MIPWFNTIKRRLIAHTHQVSLIRILKDTSLLVNPDFVLSLLYDLSDLGHQLRFLVFFQDSDVTLAEYAIDGGVLRSFDISLEMLLLRSRKVLGVA